jgi:hypothetical protein
MQGAKDLIASERGVFAIVLVVLVTVLVLMGKIPGADWLEYTKWIALGLIASKTLTGAIRTYNTTPPPAAL